MTTVTGVAAATGVTPVTGMAYGTAGQRVPRGGTTRSVR